MSINNQILIVGGVAAVAAVLVPTFMGDVPKTAPREPANVTRAEGKSPVQKNGFFGKKNKRVAKVRKRVTCDTNHDLKVSNCARSLRKKANSGKVRKSQGGRSIIVPQDAQGHFRVTTRMNGRRIPVLVDTGATSVAINMRTARRLGIELKQDDFKYEANTANGKTAYAKANIREVRIGGILVNDVPAAVLSDQALSSTLLGMSFLKRLSKYSVEDGELKMTQ